MGVPCKGKVPRNVPVGCSNVEVSRLFGIGNFCWIDNQCFFNTKYSIFGKILTVRRENMGDNWFVTWGGHNEMDVRGTVGMPSKRCQHLPDWPIVGDRVIAWLGRAKPVDTVIARREDATEIPVGLHALLLDVIEAILILSAKS